ncbi:MAG TPA: DNA adenine methylase [Solirubrobacterales bacterium]|jgi:adenine-specific DNA-methyltransferase|nr:DNA adenine methylase [Solirubrobacterales bacterium]
MTEALFDVEQAQTSLEPSLVENPEYLRRQLVTYIGNKRSLLKPIQTATETVAEALGRRPAVLDAFSGSGVVSRLFKSQASYVVANDLEPYAQVLGQCFLANEGDVPWDRLEAAISSLNDAADDTELSGGFIERLYSPRSDDHIQPGERVFYTRDNARRLDVYARLIREADEDLRPFLLGPLLSAASVNANTAGVFKGFYKDSSTGIGKFGGRGADALSRIKGRIRLQPPILSRHRGDFDVLQEDANDLPDVLDRAVDLAYLDPPYNQHPYGSNYFMLNLLVSYEEPVEVSKVSGIPTDWNRSGYNVKKKAEGLLRDLVSRLPTRFLLISFNDEGFITPEAMAAMLGQIGEVQEFRTTYNTYRGSRNLAGRSIHVTEHLYLVDRM